MDGILPSLVREDAEPVKSQVQGLLHIADALLNRERRRANFRARVRAKRRSPGRGPSNPPEVLAAESRPTEEAPESGDDENEGVPRRRGANGKRLPRIAKTAKPEEEFLSLSEAQVAVEKYRQRSRAAEAAIQASVERFDRGKRLQEPLLDDLKQLKKFVASADRHRPHLLLERRVEVGIRHTFQTAKSKKVKRWDEGSQPSSKSSSSSATDSAKISKKSKPEASETGGSFTHGPWEAPPSTSPSKECLPHPIQKQAESPELSPEEAEQQLFSLAQDIQTKEMAQSLRLQRSPGMRDTTSSNQDWLEAARSTRSRSWEHIEEVEEQEAPRHRARRAPRCFQGQVPTPAEQRAAGRRHIVFWHSSVWPKLLRGKKSSRVLREVARRDCFEDEGSPSSHAFIVAANKQVQDDKVRTLRLSGSTPSIGSSDCSFSNQKGSLARSCLKPWRSPVEALLGKSFIYPNGRRGSARVSDMLGTSTANKTGSKTERLPILATQQVEAEASSHAAWEQIKRTHGFSVLCQKR
ncbi:unnamed protein product [Effrenium voratum]|uniref:Uncharacterized protein n=1 Tax=Effrenium voratum TaxID=2562239 RepID=A0AA36HY31_9DINO|nr:unnamed protein product [Effrenium voratum]CAJ1430627.1 unnamed protein product [Effrenium voratum]